MLQLGHDKVRHQLVSLGDGARPQWITVTVEAVKGNAAETGAADEEGDADEVEVEGGLGPSLSAHIAVSLHLNNNINEH